MNGFLLRLKPIGGQALPGPTGVAHSALPDILAALGRGKGERKGWGGEGTRPGNKKRRGRGEGRGRERVSE